MSRLPRPREGDHSGWTEHPPPPARSGAIDTSSSSEDGRSATAFAVPSAGDAQPRGHARAARNGSGRRAALVRIAIFVAAIVGVFVVSVTAGLRPSPERIREWAEGFGVLAPLAFLPLAAVLNSLFVPSWVLAPSAGLLFGTALGAPVALGAIVLAASLQMTIGRYLAGDQVGRLLPVRARRFDEFLERRGFFAVLYLRLIPGAPFATVNYAAGLTRLRLRAMAAATAIGAAPRIFAYVALGGNITDLSAPEAKVALGLLMIVGLAGALLAWRQIAAERRREASSAGRLGEE